MHWGSSTNYLHYFTSINALQPWSTTWKLPISKIKTKALHLGSANPRHQYYLDDSAIEEVDEMTDLGNDCFDKHCEVIANKAIVMAFRLFRDLSSKKPEVLIPAHNPT